MRKIEIFYQKKKKNRNLNLNFFKHLKIESNKMCMDTAVLIENPLKQRIKGFSFSFFMDDLLMRGFFFTVNFLSCGV
jgi:hypothetical protein